MSYIYNLTDTWTSGATTYAGIKMAVTNTASGASSKLLDLTVSGATTGSFSVDKSGNGALSGDMAIGTTTAAARLDVRGTNILIGDNSTDANAKTARICVPHYTNSATPPLALFSSSQSTLTSVGIGGGSGSFNAATQIQFFTAANTTTLTGTERARIDANGNMGLGRTASAGIRLHLGGTVTGTASSAAFVGGTTFGSDATSVPSVFLSGPATTAAAYTVSGLNHFRVNAPTLGASSIITNQYGFFCNPLTEGTNNFGLYSNISAAPAGGTTASTVSTIASSGTTTTVVTTAAHGLSTGQVVTVAATANATALTAGATCTILTVGTTDFTLIGAASNTVGVSFTATGAGTGTGTVTINQQGSGRTITVTNSTTFTYTAVTGTYSAVTATSGSVTPSVRWNYYANGTAPNAFAGLSRFGGVTAPVATVDVTGSIAATTSILSSGGTSGIGYATGAGGTVTQVTSRTTGVTLNKVCGAITLVSNAGSATPATFTVTNSAVAATDVVVACQKSGTDKYVVLVTAVAAGSFDITIYTTGGTTTEQPVINFNVIKGVAA